LGVHTISIRNKLYSAKGLFQYLLRGEFADFFCEFSLYFPFWLFRFRAANIMANTSPNMFSRNYKTYTFAPAQENDIPEVARITGMREDYLMRRYYSGDICWVTKDTAHDNKIVNLIWSHRGPCFIRGMGLDLQVDDNSLYLYAALTLPEARMKGLYNTNIKALYEIYKEKNLSTIYGLVEYTNRNSYNLHLRLNFKPIGKVIFIALAGLKLSIHHDTEKGTRKIRLYIKSPDPQSVI
jgi:hypothetical protein